MSDPFTPAIGIIGGSGLYDFDGFEGCREIEVITPYGTPSDKIVSGTFAGRRVYFLPRHAKGHRILPTELNHRANIWAMRSLNVRWIIAVTAVGSLKEEYKPRDVLLPDQFYDRTSRREHHTFFGRGLVAHVAFADPISAGLRNLLAQEARAAGATVHNGGTYVNMDGPAFSTRAESNANRQLGFDVIGMTNLPEAKLAREAEISLATLAMITDYDCWKTDEAHVTADAVMAHVSANAAMAKAIIAKVIPRIPLEPKWPEHRALDGAIMTDRKLWPEKIVQSLKPLLQRFI
ncbi:S-methyl-5'-thioadenosine phosphorylase [Prosthecobacter fusiformis]|nr:S-methyl-5'-thioadenosine phosphorylase [Prosthecobacter fusiformis]